MKLEQLVHSVEARLFGWLANDHQVEQADERREVLAELRREEAERDRLRETRAAIAPGVESMTQEIALLPSQIESSLTRGKASQAMRQSLELESLRRKLEEARRELARLDAALWSREFRLRQLRRRFAELPSPFKRPGKRG
jgi:chromosome segregation ATPase